MKNKIFIILSILIVSISIFAVSKIDEKEYIVKAGDQFLIQAVSYDTLSVRNRITPEGYMTLFPLAEDVKVAGENLYTAKKAILQSLEQDLKNSVFNVILTRPAPTNFYVTGAVKRPGSFVCDSLLTLDAAVRGYAKILPQASRKIKLTRQNKTRTFDLNELIRKGDSSQNPIISNDDLIEVDYAESFVTVYSSNDTIPIIEYVEVSEENSVKEILDKIEYKVNYINYDQIQIKRNEEYIDAKLDSDIMSGDELYISKKARFVYVNGYVNRSGRFPYEGNREVSYYLGLAGGLNSEAATTRIYIVDKFGNKTRYKKGMPIEVGDTIYIPQSFFQTAKDIITPIGSIFTIVYTFLRIQEM